MYKGIFWCYVTCMDDEMSTHTLYPLDLTRNKWSSTDIQLEKMWKWLIILFGFGILY